MTNKNDSRATHPANNSLMDAANRLYASGKISDALAAAKNILTKSPENVNALCLAAICERRSGNNQLAENLWKTALRFSPNCFDAHINLGLLLQERRNFHQSEEAFRYATKLNPGNIYAALCLGNLLAREKKFSEAEQIFIDIMTQHENNIDSRCNLGNVLSAQCRYSEAETAYKSALAISPMHLNTLLNLGTMLWQTRRLAEAESIFRKILTIASTNIDALFNLGNVLKELKRELEAEKLYRKALELNSNHADSRWNLGSLLLSLGKFEEGWKLYRARHDCSRSGWCNEAPDFNFPAWNGEKLEGKTIVIWPEQGYGDEIQMVRYIPLLRSMGARQITLICKPPLKALFEYSAGADRVISREEVTAIATIPKHDYWVFCQDLPCFAGTVLDNIPQQFPYLTPPAERIAKWSTTLQNNELKIGLVWKGMSIQKNDHNRSLPSLNTLNPLLSIPGLSFISLQKGQGEVEAESAGNQQIILHLGSQISDFADTAAIISKLDLVICVDTAIAHLAGALNKECWVMLPYIGTDWRWLIKRQDSPWYPSSFRLFRQGESGTWDTVVDEIVTLIQERFFSKK